MKRLLVIISMVVATHAYAQEVCNDGIDNDNDGFVDCYDSKCYTNAFCENFFLGKDASCDVKPDTFPPFEMKPKYTSNGGSNHMNRLVVGDVDSDGIPEIVSGYRKVVDPKAGVTKVVTTESAINIF